MAYVMKDTKESALHYVGLQIIKLGYVPCDYDLDNIIWSNRFGSTWFAPHDGELLQRMEAYKIESNIT